MLSKISVWTFRKTRSPAQSVKDKFLQQPRLDPEAILVQPPSVHPLCVHSLPTPRKLCDESSDAQASVKTQVVIKRWAVTRNQEPVVDPTKRLPRRNLHQVVVESAEWRQWTRVHDVRSSKYDNVERDSPGLLELFAKRIDRLSVFQVRQKFSCVSVPLLHKSLHACFILVVQGHLALCCDQMHILHLDVITDSSFRCLIQVSFVLPAIAIRFAMHEDVNLVARVQEWREDGFSYATMRAIQVARLSIKKNSNNCAVKWLRACFYICEWM